MKIKFTEKDISILRVVSQISGGFTLIVALTMILSFVQLKIMKPLDSPILLSIKEQYDKDPSNGSKAEQIRAMDLMARKAYFSSRWQVETGSYLLIAGVIIFIFSQRLISENEKLFPVVSDSKQNSTVTHAKSRKYLVSAVITIIVLAIASSILLRTYLPDISEKAKGSTKSAGAGDDNAINPDKTNWPFFRGQGSRGIAGGSGYPTEWDATSGKNIGWKIELPGKGKSSPVIWGDKIFITGAKDRICEIYCIDKNTGKVLWTGSASDIPGEPAVLPKTDAEAGLAVSTAATNGKVVCAVFSNGNLVCFNMDGKLKWSENIGVPENTYGYSSSLLIFKDKLILQFDSNAKISLKSFDLETGKQVWETIRKGRAVWSSPVIGYFSGKSEIIINGNPYVSGYDALTGSELWEMECMSGDVAPSVAVNSTLVYAVTDYAKLAAIKPGTGASIQWEDNTYTPDVSSPVATDKFLFVATGNGDVACYNALKADTLWTHYFQDPFYASPVVADDMLYLLDRTGKMHVVKAGIPFSLISNSPLGEGADCSPAFSDKKIYIRGKKNLFCISKN